MRVWSNEESGCALQLWKKNTLVADGRAEDESAGTGPISCFFFFLHSDLLERMHVQRMRTKTMRIIYEPLLILAAGGD